MMACRGHWRWVGVIMALTLMLGACGKTPVESDSGASASDAATAAGASGDTDRSEGDGSGGAAIEVPPVPADGVSLPMDNGFPVEVGTALDMDTFIVTVNSITAGRTGPVPVGPEDEGSIVGDSLAQAVGSVIVDLSAENVTDLLWLGPDLTVTCVEEGDLGGTASDSEFQVLAEVGPGETVAGTAEAAVPADCSAPVVQVRVVAGNDYVAELAIPPDALP